MTPAKRPYPDLDSSLEGRKIHPWVRRALLGLLLLVPLAGLFNTFGQRTSTTSAQGKAATLRVTSPPRLRGGLIFEARFEIEARLSIAKPQLLLESGWLDRMTLNSIEPAPADEDMRDGSLELTLPPIVAGETFVLTTQWQVNPTNVGSRDEDVSLYDGETPIARADRTVTVFP